MNHNNYLVAMLDAYINWLNVWIDADPPTDDDGRRMTMQDFANNGTLVRALIPTGGSSAFERLLVEATVCAVDEGGLTDLTAWFELDTTEGTNPLRYMVQGFDTDLQFIVRDGLLVNLPT
jgi:hypothetical protein